MNFKTFNLILNLPYVVYDEIGLEKNYKLSEIENFITDIEYKNDSKESENKYEFDELNTFISKLENSILILIRDFEKEIDDNIFGLNLLEKEDLIRKYFTSIWEILDTVFIVNFEDDFDENDFGENDFDKDNPNEKTIIEQSKRKQKINQLINLIRNIRLEKFKDFFQNVVDVICYKSLQNSIDLLKIAKNNYLIFNKFNLKVYLDEINNSFLKNGSAESNFKLFFSKEIYFDFFIFLNNNFNNKISSHTKYSCIYRNMIIDGLLTEDLKPEHYKRLIFANKYATKFIFSLHTMDEVSRKSMDEYNRLKNIFFNENS